MELNNEEKNENETKKERKRNFVNNIQNVQKKKTEIISIIVQGVSR